MDCQLSPFIYTKIKVMKREALASQMTVISSFVCWPCTMPVSIPVKTLKILLTQASKGMHEPFVPMFFLVLGAHISGAEFQYPDFSWKEPTGKTPSRIILKGI